MAESGYGRIRLVDDFCGPEIPVANAVAYGVTAGGCNYYIGPFTVMGDLGETDTGIVYIDKAGGVIRISGNNEDGKGVWIGTGIAFSPVLNGALAVEARVEMAALTTRSIFIGFMGTLADDAAEPVTSTGTTLTKVATNYCGFIMDSQLTAGTEWHGVYSGGTATGPTDTTEMDLDVNAVAAEMDVLRVEIDSNGTARWYINGDLKQTVVNAVSTTALQAGGIGCWGTEAAVASIDADYLAVEANRDWTR